MADLLNTLQALGYRTIDDQWETDSRRTFIHDEPASRDALLKFRAVVARHGWHRDEHALRTFRHEATGEVLEIEPAGADCAGHYLHHIKAAVIA